MLGYSRWQILKGMVAAVAGVSIVSLLLIYFILTPRSKVTMATAFKGSSFEYYGRQYREIFARTNIELELRETAGSLENVKLLQDQNPTYKLRLCWEVPRTGNMHQDCCHWEPYTTTLIGFSIRRTKLLSSCHS